MYLPSLNTISVDKTQQDSAFCMLLFLKSSKGLWNEVPVYVLCEVAALCGCGCGVFVCGVVGFLLLLFFFCVLFVCFCFGLFFCVYIYILFFFGRG